MSGQQGDDDLLVIEGPLPNGVFHGRTCAGTQSCAPERRAGS